MIEELTTEFPLSEEHITGEQHQKDFIVLFGRSPADAKSSIFF